MRRLVVLPGVLALASCVAPPPADPPPPADAEVHRFVIDRAYSLGDPRELAFRDQIAAEAGSICGLGGYSLYSVVPLGAEEVRQDFIYRAHEVAITCDG